MADDRERETIKESWGSLIRAGGGDEEFIIVSIKKNM